MKFKFKDFNDYKVQRDEALEEAQAFLNDGKMDDYQAKVEYVKEMDEAFDEFAKNQADLKALQGTVKVPAMVTSEKISTEQDKTDTLEYRHAFMNFVLKGTPIQMNANETTTTSDVGAVIPNTILNRIIERMEKIGPIYSKMTKTFYKGGLTVPTSATKPVATWTSERGTSEKQKKSIGSISFTYHKLRCVVSVSIAVDTVTLEVFERTLVKNVADAMVKAIEGAAFNGTGKDDNMPEGILTSEITEDQIVEIEEGSGITYQDLCDAEAALPEEYEQGTEWYMRKKTYYSKIVGMTDDNGQPIARTSVGLDGKPEHSILGRKVNFTSYVPKFPIEVNEDTTVACMYNFEDYVFNTNMKISMKEYEDHDTDDQVKKAIMLADGKPISLESLVVMKVKKKVSTRSKKTVYTEEELNALTIAEIRTVAEDLGYTLSGNTKAELITSFLAAQEG